MRVCVCVCAHVRELVHACARVRHVCVCYVINLFLALIVTCLNTPFYVCVTLNGGEVLLNVLRCQLTY